MHTKRHKQTDSHINRHTDTQTHRHTDTHTHTRTSRQSHKRKQTHRHIAAKQQKKQIAMPRPDGDPNSMACPCGLHGLSAGRRPCSPRLGRVYRAHHPSSLPAAHRNSEHLSRTRSTHIAAEPAACGANAARTYYEFGGPWAWATDFVAAGALRQEPFSRRRRVVTCECSARKPR